MKILLSPAKTFAKDLILANDVPYFHREAKHLNRELNKVSSEVIKRRMKLSDDLLLVVLLYIKSFGKNHYQAIYTYLGQAFKSFDVFSLDQAAKNYMNEHLLILSGLYGILKPQDGICLYRLEMQDQTITNLYDYWRPKFINYFNTFCKDEMIINLASEEYSKALPLHLKLITIDFIEMKDGVAQKRSMAIKTMRGKFASYLIKHQIEDIEVMKSIVLDGYRYNESISNANRFTYVKEVS